MVLIREITFGISFLMLFRCCYNLVIDLEGVGFSSLHLFIVW